MQGHEFGEVSSDPIKRDTDRDEIARASPWTLPPYWWADATTAQRATVDHAQHPRLDSRTHTTIKCRELRAWCDIERPFRPSGLTRGRADSYSYCGRVVTLSLLWAHLR